MVSQASRLQDVRYDIRGPVLRRARQLEADGHQILKLNLGNPAPFGLTAPDAVLQRRGAQHRRRPGVQRRPGHLPGPAGGRRSPSSARGVAGVGPDDVFLGNGVSELIVMALQGLLDPGDEVLIPSPDYPLWTGAVGPVRRPRGALPLRRAGRLGPGPRRTSPRRSPADPGAGDHQPEQPDRGGVLPRDPARAAGPGPAARAARAHRRDLRPDPLRRTRCTSARPRSPPTCWC